MTVAAMVRKVNVSRRPRIRSKSPGSQSRPFTNLMVRPVHILLYFSLISFFTVSEYSTLLSILTLCTTHFSTVISELGPNARPGRPKELHRRHEIIDRLQTRVAPQNFTPKALYDGKAIMFASHTLNITDAGVTVCTPFYIIYAYAYAFLVQCSNERQAPAAWVDPWRIRSADCTGGGECHQSRVSPFLAPPM
jgi:hypothetical protein